MQQILKHKYLLIVALLFGSLLAVWGGPITPKALAANAPDCTYTYDGSSSIKRTGCNNNQSDGTFKKVDASLAQYDVAFQLKDGSCVSTIGFRDKDDLSSGELNGQLRDGSNCLTFDSISVSVTTDDGSGGTDTSTPEGIVEAAMSKLVDKQCKGEHAVGGSVGQNCDSTYKGYIDDCTTKAMGDAAAADDAKQNSTFISSFGKCMNNKTNGKISQNDVSKALPGDTYASLKTAQDNGGNDGDDTPTCESTGDPMSWIMCPIINGMAKAVDGIYTSMIQPLLVTRPIVLDTSDPIFQAWSQFRILGDILLVIGFLIAIYGETIGGGIVDAYTAKKMLPRILIAAIAINLSIYIVAGMVDITNIFGKGMMALIEQPFKNSGQLHFTLDNTGGTIGLAALVGGGIWAYISLAPFLQYFLVLVLVPLIFTIIAILATVILRRGAIIFLVLISPVAFALYCLPNTEQYFRKWWDILFKTLLVYPIIAVLFALGNVLSVTIGMATDGGTVVGGLSDLMSIVSLFVPLFLIPFSFRLAGGVIGRIHEATTGMRNKASEGWLGNPNDPNSRQNRYRGYLRDRNIANRGRAVDALSNMTKDDKAWKRAVGRTAPVKAAAWLANIGDLDYQRADLNKRAAEHRETKTAYGPDGSVRALFAKKSDDGIWRSVITGEKFTDSEVAKSHELYGRRAGMAATQTALDYEVTKVADGYDEYQRYMSYVPELLTDLGYNKAEQDSITKGVNYKNASRYLTGKHTKTDKNGNQTIDYAKLTHEVATKHGSYQFANMDETVPTAVLEGYDRAHLAFEEADGTTGAARNAIFEKYGFSALKGNDGKNRVISGGTESVVRNGEMVDTKMPDVEMTAEMVARRQITDAESIRDSLRQPAGGMRTGEDGGEFAGYGSATGGAGKTNDAITAFTKRVDKRRDERRSSGRNSGNSAGGSGGATSGGNGAGGGIITPGSPGFNVPPGSLPPGR